VEACRDVLWGRRTSGRSGRSIFDPEVISFAHGNGLRAPQSAVVTAGIRALLDQARYPLERYNFLERHEPLDALIHATMQGEGLPADHLGSICIDAGTSKLFVSCLMTMADRGDVVMTAPGFYHGLVGWCRLLDLGLQIAPTGPESGHKLGYHSLEMAWAAGRRAGRRPPRVVVLFNPTQTGAIYSAAEMSDIAAFCAEHDAMVIEDSIFARTRFDQSGPIAHLANDERMRDRVVTLDGCSKADGLANMRIGWAVGPPALVRAVESVKLSTTVAMPYVTLVMAEAALATGQAARRSDAAECEARAAAVASGVALLNERLGLSSDAGFRVVHEPAAGHSIMVEAGHLGPPGGPARSPAHSLQLCEDWLDRAAVGVSPLYSSGLNGNEFRLNFAAIEIKEKPIPGRWNFPVTRDPRPQIATAVAQHDHKSVTDLLRVAERSVAREPEISTIRALIHEGLVERIAGALRPRVPSLHGRQSVARARGEGADPHGCDCGSKLMARGIWGVALGRERGADDRGGDDLGVRPARLRDDRGGGLLQPIGREVAPRATVNL
jgi:aspartate aminotransferase